MESFTMLHGTIVYLGKSIMALRFFSVEGYEFEAVAVKEVCYVQDRQSKALHLDFHTGQKVPFSAVRDPSSVSPEVWKTVVLWTSFKPHSFNLCDWEMMVSKLYTDARVIQNILAGIVDYKKSPNIECRVLCYLHTKITQNLEEDAIRHIDDDDLNELLENEDIFSDYVNTIYGSVSEFMMYHCDVFQVNDDGQIHPLKAGKKFEQYMEFVSKQIGEENDQIDGSEISECSSRNVHKVFRLEKAAVSFFTSKLRGIQQKLGVVFCLSSQTLEELLDRAPEEIAFYVRKTYRSLTNFLDFHRFAFLVGPCSTVYPTTASKLQAYLTEGLKTVIPNDDFADLLYETFVQQNELASKTKQEPGNKTDAQKRITKSDFLKKGFSEDSSSWEYEDCTVEKS